MFCCVYVTVVVTVTEVAKGWLVCWTLIEH